MMKKTIQGLVLTGVMAVCGAGLSAMAQDQAPTGSANAQTGTQEHAHRRPMHAENRLAQELNLTDEQKQQIRQYREQHQPEFEALRNDKSLTQEQRHEKMKAMREQHEQFMQSILTPDQKAKWEQMQAQRKAHPHGQKNNENPTPQG
jgi:periplasmic protein CpxP/Spy